MFDALRRKAVPKPDESIRAVLNHEVGELRKLWRDGRSFLSDWHAEASAHATREQREFAFTKQLETFLEAALKEKHFKDRDQHFSLAVHYMEPARSFSVKLHLSEGDHVHLPVTEGFHLDLAPEPIPLDRTPVKPASAPSKAPVKPALNKNSPAETAAKPRPRTRT